MFKVGTKVDDVSVYISKNGYGEIQYVGIINNIIRRAKEHLITKGIQIRSIMTGLSRIDARLLEQYIIEVNGLGKNGGTLLNKINSISPKKINYSQLMQKGNELFELIN